MFALQSLMELLDTQQHTRMDTCLLIQTGHMNAGNVPDSLFQCDMRRLNIQNSEAETSVYTA